MGLAVVLMTGWNAYICLRLRPDLPTVLINLSFWFVPILVVLVVSGRLWCSLALGTAVTFVLQRLHWLKWKYSEHTWTTRAVSALVAAALVGGVFHWQAAHVFDPFGFNTYGHFANLVFSASMLAYQPPVTEGVILEHAGIALDPFFQANRAMRLLCDGKLTDCSDQALANSYRTHLYRDLQAVRVLSP